MMDPRTDGLAAGKRLCQKVAGQQDPGQQTHVDVRTRGRLSVRGGST